MANTFICESCLKVTTNRNKKLWQHCELEYCQKCAKEFIEDNEMKEYLRENDYEKDYCEN